MLVYAVFIICMLIAYNKAHSIQDSDLRNAYEIKCLEAYVATLALLAALKYVVPWSDASGYWWDYISANQHSFESIIVDYPDYFAYYTLNKLFSMTGLSAHFWFAFIEAVYFGSLMIFVNRYSKDKIYSMLLSFTIGVLGFTFMGSKQTLAMGFALFSFMFFVDKKYLYSILFLFLAYNSHHSTIFIVLCFLLWKFVDTRLYWPILIGSALVVFISGRFLITAALNMIDSEHYSSIYMEQQTKYSMTTFWYYFMFMVVALLYCVNYIKAEPRYSKLFIGGTILCLAVQSMAQLSMDFFRLAYNFIPFVIVAVPNCLETSKPNSNPMKILLACFVIFYMFYTSHGEGYRFMWEVQ